MTVAKINPLEQLIAIYGTKFHEALKAGDVTKAIRMCADYQNPDTGSTLDFANRVKAFAFRVSMESFKIPEIGPNAITIHFKPEQIQYITYDEELGRRIIYDDRFYQNDEFEFMGITLKRITE